MTNVVMSRATTRDRSDQARRPGARHRLRCGSQPATRALAHEDLRSALTCRPRGCRRPRRATAEGVTNVEFRQVDARCTRSTPGAFDIASQPVPAPCSSSTGRPLHQHCCGARPGGRLAVQAWQDVSNNESIMTVRETLAAAGPTDAPVAIQVDGADRPGRRPQLLPGAGFESVGHVDRSTRRPPAGAQSSRQLARPCTTGRARSEPCGWPTE